MSRIYVTRAVECPTLAEVVGWMTRNGWVFEKHAGPKWDDYRHGVHGIIDVPSHEGVPQLDLRIMRLLETLADNAETGSASIYDDIVKHRSEK